MLVSASITYAQSTPPDHLNLDAIPNFNYAGQDEAHKKSTCTLMFSAIQKDRWSNALSQEVAVETKNFPEFSYRLKYNIPRGEVRTVAPNTRADQILTYELLLSPSTQSSSARGSGPLRLRIQSLANNPSQIQEFTLMDTDTVTGTPLTLIACRKVASTPR